MVGLRDLDPPERTHIHDLGIAAYTMREIDERGLMSVMADAIAIAGRGTVASMSPAIPIGSIPSTRPAWERRFEAAPRSARRTSHSKWSPTPGD